jgi:hypothetical protein
LRHRFHGEYSAVIGLEFTSEAHARDAIRYLGPGWKVGEERHNILIWSGNNDQLQEVTKVLVFFGAEEKKIASVAKSIDYGEPFQVTLDVIPQEQQSLF